MNLNEQTKDLNLIDPPSKITKLEASVEWHRDKNPICLEEWLPPDELEIFTTNIKQTFLYNPWNTEIKYELEHLAKIVFNLSLNRTIFTGPFNIKVYDDISDNDINNCSAMNLRFIVFPYNEFDEDEDK